MASFWGNDHDLTPVAETLCAKYIPAVGATQYVETEVFRAHLSLHYEYFNNGMGNNMSRSIGYVERYFLDQQSEAYRAAFSTISNRAMHPRSGSRLDDEFNTIMETVVTWLAHVDATNALTPIRDTVSDMPLREMIFPRGFAEYVNDQDEDEDEEIV